MSNNNTNRDLLSTPDEDKRFRVLPSIVETPKKTLPGPFPNIQVVEQQKTPYFDGLRENERSLITNNEQKEQKEQKKGGSLKHKKRVSCKNKNKKRVTRKMRKSHINKKHK